MPVIVYKKSARGLTCLSDRSQLSDAKMRGLLILVDGKKTRDQLLRFGAAFGDVDVLLEKLLEQGWVETAESSDSTAASAIPSSPVAAASAPKPARQNLTELKRDTVRKLNDLLGPNADQLALKIERSTTVEQLRMSIEQAAQAVMNFRGPTLGQSFYDGVISKLPPE